MSFQGTIQSLCLIGLTTGKLPMIVSDWKHLLPEEARELQNKLKKRLTVIAKEVDKRNEVAGEKGQRPRVCESFNPEYHECSVSV